MSLWYVTEWEEALGIGVSLGLAVGLPPSHPVCWNKAPLALCLSASWREWWSSSRGTHRLQGLSGKSPAIVNIMTIVFTTPM